MQLSLKAPLLLSVVEDFFQAYSDRSSEVAIGDRTDPRAAYRALESPGEFAASQESHRTGI